MKQDTLLFNELETAFEGFREENKPFAGKWMVFSSIQEPFCVEHLVENILPDITENGQTYCSNARVLTREGCYYITRSKTLLPVPLQLYPDLAEFELQNLLFHPKPDSHIDHIGSEFLIDDEVAKELKYSFPKKDFQELQSILQTYSPSMFSDHKRAFYKKLKNEIFIPWMNREKFQGWFEHHFFGFSRMGQYINNIKPSPKKVVNLKIPSGDRFTLLPDKPKLNAELVLGSYSKEKHLIDFHKEKDYYWHFCKIVKIKPEFTGMLDDVNTNSTLVRESTDEGENLFIIVKKTDLLKKIEARYKEKKRALNDILMTAVYVIDKKLKQKNLQLNNKFSEKTDADGKLSSYVVVDGNKSFKGFYTFRLNDKPLENVLEKFVQSEHKPRKSSPVKIEPRKYVRTGGTFPYNRHLETEGKKDAFFAIMIILLFFSLGSYIIYRFVSSLL